MPDTHEWVVVRRSRRPRARRARRSLVVVCGLPGAGKSTLLGRVDRAGRCVLDPEQVARALSSTLVRVPYQWYRPIVHLVHWARVSVTVCTTAREVVVHETGTRAVARAVLTLLGRVSRRRRVLVWLDVDDVTARRGQRLRGRVLPARSHGRHALRAHRLAPVLRAGHLTGWDELVVLGRVSPVGGPDRVGAPWEQPPGRTRPDPAGREPGGEGLTAGAG